MICIVSMDLLFLNFTVNIYTKVQNEGFFIYLFVYLSKNNNLLIN